MRTAACCCALIFVTASALGENATFDAPPSAASAGQANELVALEALRRPRDASNAVTESEAALDIASRIVIAAEGWGDAGTSEDLLQLGTIHAHFEDHEAAEANHLRAIEVLEREGGIFSPALIVPYQELGRTYIQLRRFPDAINALERALSISRRTRGLFNLEQMALIDDMTHAHVESGDWAAARAVQVERLERAIRHFGPGTPELIAYHQHLGDYFALSRAALPAQAEYRKALEISNANYGESSAESIELLRRLSAIELLITRRPHTRDRLAAALSTATAISAEQRGKSLAALGDWDTVNGDLLKAEHYYADAYQALQEAEDIDADQYFAKPMMLDFIPPWDDVDGAAQYPRWTWGRIELAYDVSATGRAGRVRTVAMEPRIDDLERKYRRGIRETRFRPALENGRPVARSDVRYERRFRYYVRN